MDDFKWDNKAGGTVNAAECELQKRVVGLIADARGSLLSSAIVSFLSFLTNWNHALALYMRYTVYELRAATFHSKSRRSHTSFQRERDV